ncbi:MAG: MBL fold metallo-hydrolase [Burkholderiaceae bacterium]
MSWTIGRFTITPIREQAIHGLEDLIKEANPHTLAAIEWLRPHYMTDDFKLKGWIQSFLIRGGEQTVLVDTCVGNDKERPNDPGWHRQQRAFLAALAATGVSPEQIDVVLCTHLHVDHVGWNTFWDGNAWRPTFPRARYLFERSEFEHWQALAAGSEPIPEPGESRKDAALRRFRETQRLTFNDSVAPVAAAGLARAVERDHRVCEGIELMPTPGHTPGHVSVRVSDGTAQAVISGDCVHHPCQIAHPGWRTLVDTDHRQAAATREQLFCGLAKRGGLLIGSHFADPCAGTLTVDGDGYRFHGGEASPSA